MDTLSVVRFISVVGWLYLGWRTAKPAARAFTVRAQTDDPWFAIVLGFGGVFLIFAARFYFLTLPPLDSASRDWLLIGYLLTIALQLVVLRFAAWGRANAS